MAWKGFWEPVKRQVRLLIELLISAMMEGLLLILWALVQYVVDKVLKLLPLEGFSEWQLKTFQTAFAVMSLVPVVGYIWDDVKRTFTGEIPGKVDLGRGEEVAGEAPQREVVLE